jgi:predicted patatin/cPLA2 family phospholipase
MPILYRTFPLIDGQPTADGGIADPLPVKEALKRGARKIMVIRSRPRAYQKKETLSQALMLRRLKHFPSLRDIATGRIRRYNESVAQIRKPPRGVSIIEICPPESFRPTRLGRNLRILKEGYQQGRKLAGEAIRSWESHDS